MNTENNQEKLNKFKKLLEEEKMTLLGEIDSVKPKFMESDENRDRADETEVADDIEEQDNNAAIEVDLNKRLEEVNAALENIDREMKGGEREYGICTVCGNEIEEDRLEANPSATTCKAHM
jgi:RNA polymerase-binding transcription factor DksA